MVIKDAKKYSSEGTMQKKNKTKRATGNPLVIIDEEAAIRFGLPTKAKRKKKKHSEGSISNQKKKLDSKLKNAACIDLPIIIQNSSDLESIKEAEKPRKALKKKRKRGLSCGQESGPEIPSQGQTTECQEANILLGKKRRKNVPDTSGSDSGCNRKKKKRKKHKLASSLILSHASRGTRNGVLEGVTADHIHEVGEENNGSQDYKDTTYLLKKRRQVTDQEGKKKRKKKKKKLKEEEGDSLLTAGKQEKTPAETLWKAKFEEKQEKTDRIQQGDSKGRKKKKICAKVSNHYPDLLEDNKGAFDQEEKALAIKRAKKKAKKAKKEQDRAARLERVSFRKNSDTQRNAMKKKARKSKGSEGPEEEPSSKRAKIKEEAKEREDEIQVVALKKGNCDEVQIDKLRRQALQEEIDRESGKTKAIKEEDKLDPHFGQWSTATFASAEQKSKFLRLLGGFKKGSASTQEWPPKARPQSMALARDGEEKLQQTLQAEFQKAVDWKQWRGAGLGFQPAAQKRAHIDKYASKSIKFED